MSVVRKTPAFLVAALAVGSGLMLGAVPAGHAAGGRTVQAQAATSLAGHRWRHSVQVDGKAGRDAVVIIGGKDLTLDSFREGLGHIQIRVHLAKRRRTLSTSRVISYVSPRSPWTPWVGATNLDHRGGKELLVGFSTGAHTQILDVLHYRAGRLRALGAPRGASWVVNSSFGTGSSGWRCTRRGVESRSVFPGGGSPTYRIVRNRYVWRTSGWVRTGHVAQTVAADAQGNPPASTNGFPRFICRGLPRNVL